LIRLSDTVFDIDIFSRIIISTPTNKGQDLNKKNNRVP